MSQNNYMIDCSCTNFTEKLLPVIKTCFKLINEIYH